jgi:hypothetical protein
MKVNKTSHSELACAFRQQTLNRRSACTCRHLREKSDPIINLSNFTGEMMRSHVVEQAPAGRGVSPRVARMGDEEETELPVVGPIGKRLLIFNGHTEEPSLWQPAARSAD